MHDFKQNFEADYVTESGFNMPLKDFFEDTPGRSRQFQYNAGLYVNGLENCDLDAFTNAAIMEYVYFRNILDNSIKILLEGDFGSSYLAQQAAYSAGSKIRNSKNGFSAAFLNTCFIEIIQCCYYKYLCDERSEDFSKISKSTMLMGIMQFGPIAAETELEILNADWVTQR